MSFLSASDILHFIYFLLQLINSRLHSCSSFQIKFKALLILEGGGGVSVIRSAVLYAAVFRSVLVADRMRSKSTDVSS